MIRAYGMDEGRICETENISDGLWIRVTVPTDDEIKYISETTGIDIMDLNTSLDRDEGSRFDTDDGVTSILIDVPYRKNIPKATPFDTVPLAMIVADKRILTLSQIESEIVDKIADGKVKGMDISNLKDFVPKMMFNISLAYQQNLRELNIKRREIENRISESKDDDIIDLHKMESSLVYFSTSLYAMNTVLVKMKRSNLMDEDLLQDVHIEIQQAMEMASIYREIIDGTRELYESIVNRKLNDVMKWLTAITLIFSVPMIICGIYGMNVPLPYSGDSLSFSVLMSGTLMLCAGMALVLRRKGML